MMCRHRNIRWPMTINGETRVWCPDCLRHLRYDWEKMRIVEDEEEGFERVA